MSAIVVNAKASVAAVVGSEAATVLVVAAVVKVATALGLTAAVAA